MKEDITKLLKLLDIYTGEDVSNIMDIYNINTLDDLIIALEDEINILEDTQREFEAYKDFEEIL